MGHIRDRIERLLAPENFQIASVEQRAAESGEEDREVRQALLVALGGLPIEGATREDQVLAVDPDLQYIRQKLSN
ncbi:MAG: hypothetical protein JWP13_744 [Candidatus Saccharibacteria bacterium]|nr:hypothetical protein [Candidatus Saccharibacteria bacterium]